MEFSKAFDMINNGILIQNSIYTNSAMTQYLSSIPTYAVEEVYYNGDQSQDQEYLKDPT